MSQVLVTSLFIYSLGPNSLILVSHQVVPLHTMRAGGYYHYVFNNSQQIFLTIEPNNHDAGRINAHCTPLQKGFFECFAVEKHVY